jgi:hypothetical protein
MVRRPAFVAVLVTIAVLAAPASSLAGDAFLKFAYIFHPDRDSFSNSWLISVGSDWGFHPQGFFGLEFQGAYYSEDIGDPVALRLKTVPANVFANFKWKSEAESVRPFVGGGVGLVSAYVKAEAFGEEENEWVKDGGFHFMGGVEFSRRWVVEIMGQRIFESDAEWEWMVLGGIRW